MFPTGGIGSGPAQVFYAGELGASRRDPASGLVEVFIGFRIASRVHQVLADGEDTGDMMAAMTSISLPQELHREGSSFHTLARSRAQLRRLSRTKSLSPPSTTTTLETLSPALGSLIQRRRLRRVVEIAP